MDLKNTVLKRIAPMLIALLLFSCDDEIHVKTSSADPILNVDAWVNDKPAAQVISLTMTQDYFDNSNLPPAASGANVVITDSYGKAFVFVEDTVAKDGTYRWSPQDGETLGVPGTGYTLTVTYQGETFVATSAMKRVPPVDSITFEKRDNVGMGNDEDFYDAEFWATDPAGKGDTYWIRTYKNGALLNKASELTIAYDAAISAGSEFDGVTFISAVRKGINADDTDADDKPVSPLIWGDSIYVEINSITLQSFNYLNEVVEQTDKNGGLSELFTSTPLANVSSNLVNLNGNGSPIVGFFNVASVAGLGKKFRRR